MSEAEKSAQVGDAVLLLAEQKAELAHVVEKLEKVKRAYQVFACESGRWAVDPTRPDHALLAHPNASERDLGEFLLPQAQLAALILERGRAQAAVAETRAKLAGFGIVSL